MKNFLMLPILLMLASVLIMCTNSSTEKEQGSTNQQTESVAEEEGMDLIVEQDTIKGSISSEATGSIGGANIKINYYSPGVKGRILWGGLVPYDKVWATGAHMATSVAFDKAVNIGGQEIPAGKYALFTIPGREEWTVIINKNWEQHLTDDYDQKEDVMRINLAPSMQDRHQERLKYEIKELSKNKGAINISWDELTLALPVSI